MESGLRVTGQRVTGSTIWVRVGSGHGSKPWPIIGQIRPISMYSVHCTRPKHRVSPGQSVSRVTGSRVGSGLGSVSLIRFHLWRILNYIRLLCLPSLFFRCEGEAVFRISWRSVHNCCHKNLQCFPRPAFLNRRTTVLDERSDTGHCRDGRGEFILCPMVLGIAIPGSQIVGSRGCSSNPEIPGFSRRQ